MFRYLLLNSFVSSASFNRHSVRPTESCFAWRLSILTLWLNGLMGHHVTIVLCPCASHRDSLQRNPSVIWLWPGAGWGAPGSPPLSLLRRLSYLLSTAPLQDPEQPRHPVVWLPGVHAVGKVQLHQHVWQLCLWAHNAAAAGLSPTLLPCPSLSLLLTQYL